MEEPTIAIPKSLYDELIRKAKAYDNMTAHLGEAGKKSSAKLTPEQRKERAKKAVEARIAKSGQRKRQ